MNNRKSFWFVSFLYLISPAESCGLASVGTWRLSKSNWPLDRQLTWKSRWGPFTVSHNSTKFNGHGIVKLEMLHLSANITCSHDRWVTWFEGWDTFTLNHKSYNKSNRTLCFANWGSFVLSQIRANFVTNWGSFIITN